MNTDFFDAMKNSSPTQAQVQDQRRRANQQPAIHGAQTTADAGLVQPPIGSMMDYGAFADTPDEKWLLCDGRILSYMDYPDLYAVLGATWNTGGEPSATFRIPDRRGRVTVGAGQGSGLSDRPPGSRFGAEAHALTISQLPAHGHSGSTESDTHFHAGDTYTDIGYYTNVSLSGGGGISVAYDDTYLNTSTDSDTHSHSFTTNNAGGGQAHDNIQPSIAIPTIIRALI